MRVLFHIPKDTLSGALKFYNTVSAEYYHKGLQELMLTLEFVLEAEKVPTPKTEWPVSYEAACDVVSALHDQLAEAHAKIDELQKELFNLDRAPDNNGERPAPKEGV